MYEGTKSQPNQSVQEFYTGGLLKKTNPCKEWCAFEARQSTTLLASCKTWLIFTFQEHRINKA